MYVNKCYCCAVRGCICTPDIELLSVSLCPFYLHREFPQLFITIVYIHPNAHPASTCSIISEVVQKLQAPSPDAPKFIMGDFNHVSLKSTLGNLYPYVSCPTRQDKILDLCYVLVENAYKSLLLPPLGSADHNCVHLLPICKTVLKRDKTRTKDVDIWSEESVLTLQECF